MTSMPFGSAPRRGPSATPSRSARAPYSAPIRPPRSCRARRRRGPTRQQPAGRRARTDERDAHARDMPRSFGAAQDEQSRCSALRPPGMIRDRCRRAPARNAVAVVRRLRAAGYEALLAGGCVRDELLGAHAEGLRRRDQRARGARADALRRESRRSASSSASCWCRRATIASRSRPSAATASISTRAIPSPSRFGNAEEDAARRDFTINGMFLDPIDGPRHRLRRRPRRPRTRHRPRDRRSGGPPRRGQAPHAARGAPRRAPRLRDRADDLGRHLPRAPRQHRPHRLGADRRGDPLDPLRGRRQARLRAAARVGTARRRHAGAARHGRRRADPAPSSRGRRLDAHAAGDRPTARIRPRRWRSARFCTTSPSRPAPAARRRPRASASRSTATPSAAPIWRSPSASA